MLSQRTFGFLHAWDASLTQEWNCRVVPVLTLGVDTGRSDDSAQLSLTLPPVLMSPPRFRFLIFSRNLQNRKAT